MLTQACFPQLGVSNLCPNAAIWSNTSIYVPARGDGGAIQSSGSGVIRITSATFRGNAAPRGKSISVRLCPMHS